MQVCEVQGSRNWRFSACFIALHGKNCDRSTSRPRGRLHNKLRAMVSELFTWTYCYQLSNVHMPSVLAQHISIAKYQLSSRTPPSNILPQSIPRNLIPFNLLSCNRQLPPQTLKCSLAQVIESLVQLLLIFLFRNRNLPNN